MVTRRRSEAEALATLRPRANGSVAESASRVEPLSRGNVYTTFHACFCFHRCVVSVGSISGRCVLGVRAINLCFCVSEFC